MTKVVKWFVKAAKQGKAAAECNLGKSYYLWNSIAQDNEQVVKWFASSA